MKLRAYRRWATGKDGWDTYRDRWAVEAPTQYPCYAYTVVRDYGMEEESPRYLYPTDLWDMLAELKKIPSTDGRST